MIMVYYRFQQLRGSSSVKNTNLIILCVCFAHRDSRFSGFTAPREKEKKNKLQAEETIAALQTGA